VTFRLESPLVFKDKAKMGLTAFADKFAREFEEAGSITPSTRFKDLEEWSSMQALIIIAMIDEEFGVTLTAEDLQKSTTVEDLYKIVQSRQQ